MKDLGTLSGNDTFAYSINNRRQIVGKVNIGSDQSHAVLWVNDTMRDLNSLITANSGWELSEAWDINNLGQIVGWGKFNAQYHAFLLTPQWVTQ